MSDIAVLGSLNLDLVVTMEGFPQPGETVHAREVDQVPGGKGANQAVACGRLGQATTMYGAVGDDGFQSPLLASLEATGVRTDEIRHCEDVSTGTASIWVDDSGENAIAIVAGANGRVDASYVDEVWGGLTRASWLLFQLEIPTAAMAHALSCLPDDGPQVVLDPAPVQGLGGLPLERVRVLTPNRQELRALTGGSTDGPAQIEAACRALREDAVGSDVVCKAGADGAYVLTNDRFEHIPGFSVEVVDTTAAGDAFNAGLAAALSGGRRLEDAIRFANAVGALATTAQGAQPSMPTQAAVRSFLNRVE
ncbi:MAG: ribokinase, partial [Candidatus Bipolaricaulia bacterium]